jgi:hypothetical protein
VRNVFLVMTLISVSLVYAGDHGKNASKKSSVRKELTSKETRLETLRAIVAAYEVRAAELELERVKRDKIDKGNRSKAEIQAAIEEVTAIIKSKKEEIELTEKLFSDSCKGRIAVQERSEKITDPDTGFTIGSRSAHYLVCQVVAQTCDGHLYATGYLGRRGSEAIRINGTTDSRVGEDCNCYCRLFRSDY